MKRGYQRRSEKKKDDKRNDLQIGQNKSYISVFGNDAKPEIRVKGKYKNIKVRDIQGVITFILADGTNPNWIDIRCKYLISKVVVLYFSAMNLSFYEQGIKDGHFKMIDSIFSSSANGDNYRWTCGVPGSKTKVLQCLPILLSRPSQQKKYNKFFKPLSHVQSRLPIQHYLLTTEQLCDNNYPFLHNITTTTTSTTTSTTSDQQLQNKYDGFIRFEDGPGLSLVAIDCEMCLTSVGLELTRVSLIDEHENILYDHFVKPANPIIDYLTQYSGVSESNLVDVTRTVEDVREDIKKWISGSTILIGHSLENDLVALKIFHNKIIDTAILYPHEVDGFKNSLKILAIKYLNLDIQGSKHDSVEDAIAALRLANLKFSNGPTFGIPLVDNENLFTILSNHNRKSSYIDHLPLCKKYGGTASLLPVQEDKEACQKIITQVANKEINFVLGRFTVIEKCFSENVELGKAAQQLDDHVAQIYDSLPDNTLLITLGDGSTNTVKKLQTQKKESLEKWTQEMQDSLLNAISEARRGLCFFAIKQSAQKKQTKNESK